MSTSPPAAPAVERLLLGAFLVSGATGLVYEVIWGRYLTLLVGSSSRAHSIVLATFMGGLAAGNAFFGRRADRPGARPLRMYALLETGIGIVCLLFPASFALLARLYVAAGSAAGPGAAVNDLLKTALAAASMFVPCALMGGTLPVLTRYTVRSTRALGARLSGLYFLNTAGAAAGSLLGGFYVVEVWGLEAGMVLAALVNLAIGALFLLVSSRTERDGGVVAGEAAEGDAETAAPSVARLALVAAGLGGALAMLYELAWTRVLVLCMGGTVHSFSTMLAGFISGIALGAALVGRWMRRPHDALTLLAVCQAGVALSVLASMPLYPRLPYAFYRLGSTLVHGPETYPLFLAGQVAFAWALMLVPTTFMGASLPLATRLYAVSSGDVGKRVGDVFSVNTMGTVFGAVLTGFLFLPSLGLQRTLLLGVVVSGTLAVILLRASARRAWAGLLVLLVAAAISSVALGGWDARYLDAGLYRWETNLSFPSWSAFAEDRVRRRLLYARDGADASVTVEESGSVRALIINGKPDAGNGADLPNQLMLGHLGMVLHPGARDVLVIGLGSGTTADAVLHHPEARVDVAEISPEVVEAAGFFRDINRGVLENPRLRMHVLDARELLLLDRRAYDVIVSEPTNLWVPGVPALFTDEFYAMVEARLRPDGLLVQWIHVYASDRRIVSSVLATLTRHFPSVTLWAVDDADILMVASRAPVAFDPDRFAERLRASRPTEGLRRDPRLALFEDPVLFLLNQVASPATVRLTWPPRQGRVLKDLWPRLEFEAARAQYAGRPYTLLDEIDERLGRTGPEPLLLERYLERHPLSIADATRVASALVPLTPAYSRVGWRILGNDVRRSGTGLGGLPSDLAAPIALARSLGVELDAGAPSVATCRAYLHAEAEVVRVTGTILSRPATDDLDRRGQVCLAAFPEHADDWGARLVLALQEADDASRAARALERLQASGALERLPSTASARMLARAAGLLLRTGDREGARAAAQTALQRDPRSEQAARVLLALEGP